LYHLMLNATIGDGAVVETILAGKVILEKALGG
jgi:hypothetical protein